MSSKGTLTNKRSGTALELIVNPSDFTLENQLSFGHQAVLGASRPIVDFQSCGPAMFNFSTAFDTDLGSKSAPMASVLTFLKEAQAADPKSLDVPTVEFKMGSFVFAGFLKSYRIQATKFDSKGEATALRLNIGLISTGLFESGE